MKKSKFSKQIEIDKFCADIKEYMAEGYSLDGALAIADRDKSLYNKIARNKKVMAAVIDGESKRKAYWETKMKETANKTGKMCNPAVVIKMYESCLTEDNMDNASSVPKIQVFGIGSKKTSVKKIKTTTVESSVKE